MSQPRPSRGAYVAFGALWFMRLGILGMLAVILAVLWQRYHLSDDQQELARYVETEVPVLLRAEQPVLQRVADLLDGDFQPNEPLRRGLQEDLMPQLIRLRKAAQAPRTAAKTRAVQVLADEYLATVERLIEVARTALDWIDQSGSPAGSPAPSPAPPSTDLGAQPAAKKPLDSAQRSGARSIDRHAVKLALHGAATARADWQEHVAMTARAQGLAIKTGR